MAAARPPASFRNVTLVLHTLGPGARFGRIFAERFPDPLGFGKGPSRFSDPRRRVEKNRFGVLYLGSSLEVCLLEALVRDRRDGLPGDLWIGEDELASRRYAEIEVRRDLRLVDLRGSAPVQMGVPSDVRGASSHALSRRWSAAFHDHPSVPDGIIYPSRLGGEANVAVYDRAIGKLSAASVSRLADLRALPSALNALRVDILP